MPSFLIHGYANIPTFLARALPSQAPAIDEMFVRRYGYVDPVARIQTKCTHCAMTASSVKVNGFRPTTV
jgi:hypothetical protein